MATTSAVELELESDSAAIAADDLDDAGLPPKHAVDDNAAPEVVLFDGILEDEAASNEGTREEDAETEAEAEAEVEAEAGEAPNPEVAPASEGNVS